MAAATSPPCSKSHTSQFSDPHTASIHQGFE